jgi:hypothetical protein
VNELPAQFDSSEPAAMTSTGPARRAKIGGDVGWSSAHPTADLVRVRQRDDHEGGPVVPAGATTGLSTRHTISHRATRHFFQGPRTREALGEPAQPGRMDDPARPAALPIRRNTRHPTCFPALTETLIVLLKPLPPHSVTRKRDAPWRKCHRGHDRHRTATLLCRFRQFWG